MRTAQIAIAGIRATVYFMSPTAPAFYAGHVVVLWRQRDETFDVTVHGFRWATRAQAMARALIEEIRRCPQASSTRPCRGVFSTS